MFVNFRHLSLDVALGALLSGAMAAWLLESKMPPAWWYILPACVWVIYTTDHLLDAKRLGGGAAAPRRIFHQDHFPVLSILDCFILSSLPFISIFFLPPSLIVLGFSLTLFILFYFVMVHWLRHVWPIFFQKEVLVACVFSMGVWGGPFLLATHSIGITEIGLFAAFLLTAFLNLILFSTYESEIDHQEAQRSLVNMLGGGKSDGLIRICFLVILAVAGTIVSMNFLNKQGITALALIIMNILLLILFLFPHQLQKNERYRWIGDGVFLIPGFTLLLV